jgi:hypothetical protein
VQRCLEYIDIYGMESNLGDDASARFEDYNKLDPDTRNRMGIKNKESEQAPLEL